MTSKTSSRARPRRVATPPPPADAEVEVRILEAARRVFTRYGTAGARMQQIAAEAGVNQALIHYYFRSKEQLAERIFVEAIGKLVQGLVPAIAAEATLEQVIERFVYGYIDGLRESPFIPSYVLSESYHYPERLEPLIRRAFGTVPSAIGTGVLARVTQLVDEAVAAGRMRPMTPRQLLINVLAMVVFPFAARPVLMTIMGLDEDGFDQLLTERRATLPGFILTAIRP